MDLEKLEKLLSSLPREKFSSSADFQFQQELALARNKTTFKYLNFFNFNSMAKKLALSFAVIALVLLGGTAYAYFSPSVTAGQALYPVKTGLENIKLSQANTPIKKVIAYNNLANRRLAEAMVLAEKLNIDPNAFSLIKSANAAEITPIAGNNAGPLTATIKAITANVNKAIEASKEITDPAIADRALTLLSQSGIAQDAGLKEVAGRVGTLVKPTVIEAVAEAIDSSVANQTKAKIALDEIKQKIAKGEKKIKVNLKSAKDTEEDDLKKIKEEEDNNNTEETAAELTKDLVEAKDGIESLKEKLTAAGISTEKTAKLFEHLDNKLAQAETALADNNLNQAYGLLHALDAVTNNAEHFLKNVDDAKDKLEKSSQELEQESLEKEDQADQDKAAEELEKATETEKETAEKEQELINEQDKKEQELTNEQDKKEQELLNEQAKQTQELQTENTKETE
jgi:hypothetical protein